MVDTLADRILAPNRTAYHRVRIANIPIIPLNPTTALGIPGIGDIRYQESLDQPCPVCTLEMNRGVDWIKDGYPVHVDLGYDGLSRRVFTGTVQQRGRPGVAKGQIDCAGELWKLMRATFDVERDVGGLTVAQAIAAIFADVNILNYDLSGVPAYTLAVDAILMAGTGMAQLTELMKIDGLRVRETGSGQVVVGRYEGQPSASYFRKYSTTDTPTMRILEGGVTEDPGWYRTQITVLGARLADGTDISATVTLSDTSLAQPPLAAGKQIPDTFSIPLIWDTAKALAAAIRIAGEHGRIPQSFRVTIPMDMELEIGMTLNIDAPEWGVSGNWLIWGITHNAASDTTVCDLRGGPQFGGTINVNPIAQFTFTAENQPLGAQRYTFVTLDASGSYQPDNANEVLTFDWSGDQDAADSPDIDAQTAEKFTVRINPTAMSGDVLTVTLVVMNEAGLTATVIQEINVTPEGTDAIVVALFAALGTRFAASMDGGENWNFQTGTDITTVAAAPPDGVHTGYAVFGRLNGQIYRTTDGCVTAPTSVKAANSIAIADVQWDWRDPSKVWVLDVQANLYVSTDYGASFVLIADFRTSLSLSTIIGKKLGLPGAGGTWVFGGTGVVGNGRPFIGWFDTSVHGLASVFGGELQTDLGSGSTNLAIVDAVDRGDGGGLIIILENYTASDSGVRPIYLTNSPFEPVNWKRATGLTAGLTTPGRVVLPGNTGPGRFHALFNNRDVWHIDGTTGVPVCTLQANVLDVGFTPNEGLWMREEAEGLTTVECHLLAIEDAAGNGAIVKSFDDLVTVAAVLPGMTAWPVVGAQGKDVAIGPVAQMSTAAKVIIGGLLSSPTERFIAWREGVGNFESHVFPTNLDTKNDFFIRAITTDLWFAFWYPLDGVDNQDDAVAVRTKDGGAAWDDLYGAPTTGGLTRAWQDIRRAADGRLWGVTCEVGGTTPRSHMEIWYSDDSGDTWTESKDDTDTVNQQRIMHVVPHPTNPNRIAIMGKSGGTSKNCVTWFTTDRGANWTKNVVNNLFVNGGAFKKFDRMMLASNRIVQIGWQESNGDFNVWTSDDNGASWVPRLTKAKQGAGVDFGYGPVGDPVGGRLFIMWENRDVVPCDIQIYESTDQGQTWTQTVSDALGNKPPQPATTDNYFGGLDFNPTEGALYLFGAGVNNANNISQVVKSVGLGWQDVSDALLPLSGHTSYDFGVVPQTTHGIAVIPS